jgi:hypothetical protein
VTMVVGRVTPVCVMPGISANPGRSAQARHELAHLRSEHLD